MEWYAIAIRLIHRDHMDEVREGPEWYYWRHPKPTDRSNVVS